MAFLVYFQKGIKQTQIFQQNQLLVLHAVEIFYNLLDWYWFYDILELDLKSAQTILQDLGWLCDILNVDSKDTRAKLLDSDWLHYDQAGMLQQKNESIL